MTATPSKAAKRPLVVEGGDVFADGPINKRGEWEPKDGRESYFHAHLSELDDEGERPGDLTPLEEEDLRVGDQLIRAQQALASSGPEPEAESTLAQQQLQAAAKVLGALVLQEPHKAVAGIEILVFEENGSVIKRGGANHTAPVQLVGASAAKKHGIRQRLRQSNKR